MAITISPYQVIKLDGVTINDVKYCDELERHYVEHRGTNYIVDEYTLPQTDAFTFTVVLVENPKCDFSGVGVVRSIKCY